MKKLVALPLLLCLFLTPVLLDAQRIANEPTLVRYNRLPTRSLPSEYTTYSASINTPNTELSQLGLSKEQLINSYLDLRAFKKLDQGGHFHINIEIGRLNITKLENKEIETTKEDKEGNKTTTKSYQKIVTYTTTSSLQLVDIGGNILIEKIINTPKLGAKYTFIRDVRGPKQTGDPRNNFRSLEALEKDWESRQIVVINEITKKEINKAFKTYSELIYNTIDTRVTTKRIDLQLPKGRKVANAEEFASITEQAVAILSKMTAESTVIPLRSEMAPIFDFWIAQSEAYDPNDKHSAKVHHACLYNLALTHFYLENFPVARQYLARCETLDVKKGLTQDLAERIELMTSNMLKKGVTSLHFGFDLENEQSPADANYAYLYGGIPVPAKTTTLPPHQIAGYIITIIGDSIPGSFIFSDGKVDDPKFYEGGNVTFTYDDDNKTIKRLIDPREITRLAFNDRQFIHAKFSEVLSPIKRFNLLEILETGPKMTLYYFHPFHSPGDGNLAIQKRTNTPLNLNILNPRFTKWKTSFGALFEDCPGLKAAIEAGEYGRNEANIRRAIQQYNEDRCE